MPIPIEEAIPIMLNELMEFDNANDFWDYPPILYLVSSPHDDDPEKYRVHMLDVGEVWALADTSRVLHSIANALAIPDAPINPIDIEPGDRILAAVMRNEAWKLSTDDGLTQEEIHAWHESGKRFAEHPKAREVKQYMGYWPDTNRTVTYVRQTGELIELPEAEGLIAEGLKLLLTNANARDWSA